MEKKIIHHFRIANAPCLSPLFPKFQHNHCFQFLLGITVVPREIEDDAYAKVLEVNSIMGNLKLEEKIVPPI